MRNFQDTFEIRKRLFVSAFSICMTVPLKFFSVSIIKKMTFILSVKPNYIERKLRKILRISQPNF